MPLRKTQQGRPVLQYFTAEAFNAFVDAAEKAKNFSLIPPGPRPYTGEACLFPVLNDTGSALARFDVVGLDEPIVLPASNLQEFQNLVAFRARVPTADDEDRFAVVQEPLADGAIGMAAIAGVTVVKTYATDATEATYRFAQAVAGVSGRLGMLSGAGSPILYRAAGTGSQWSIIRIDATASNFVKKGYLDGDLTYNSSATCSVYTGAGGSAVDSGDNLTVYCWLLQAGDTLPAATRVVIGYTGDHWEVIAAECPDSGS